MKATTVGIFVLALTVRIGFLAVRGPGLPPDAGHYLRLSENLQRSGSFSLDASPPLRPTVRRAPLYPALLALLGVPPRPVHVAAAVQVGLDASVAVALLLLARWAGAGPWATVAAAAYALHPGAIVASTAMLSEAVTTALLAAAVLLLARGMRSDSRWLAAVSGLLFGGAALARPLYLLLPVAVAVAMPIVMRWKRSTGAPRGFHPYLVLLGAAVAVAPWVCRSHAVAQRFVLIQAGGAIQPYVASRYDWDQNDEARVWGRLRREPLGHRFDGQSDAAEMAAADAELLGRAWHNISQNPGAYLASRARALPHLMLTSFDWFTGLNVGFRDLLRDGSWAKVALKLALLLSFSALPLALGLLGLRSSDDVALLCATAWLFTALSHVPLWIEYRFWLPTLPCLLVSASLGAHRLSNRRSFRSIPA